MRGSAVFTVDSIKVAESLGDDEILEQRARELYTLSPLSSTRKNDNKSTANTF